VHAARGRVWRARREARGGEGFARLPSLPTKPSIDRSPTRGGGRHTPRCAAPPGSRRVSRRRTGARQHSLCFLPFQRRSDAAAAQPLCCCAAPPGNRARAPLVPNTRLCV